MTASYDINDERQEMLSQLIELPLRGFEEIAGDATPSSAVTSLPTTPHEPNTELQLQLNVSDEIEGPPETPYSYVTSFEFSPPLSAEAVHNRIMLSSPALQRPHHTHQHHQDLDLDPLDLDHLAPLPHLSNCGAPKLKDYDTFTEGTAKGSFDSVPAASHNEYGEQVSSINTLSLALLPEQDCALSIEHWREDVHLHHTPVNVPVPRTPNSTPRVGLLGDLPVDGGMVDLDGNAGPGAGWVDGLVEPDHQEQGLGLGLGLELGFLPIPPLEPQAGVIITASSAASGSTLGSANSQSQSNTLAHFQAVQPTTSCVRPFDTVYHRQSFPNGPAFSNEPGGAQAGNDAGALGPGPKRPRSQSPSSLEEAEQRRTRPRQYVISSPTPSYPYASLFGLRGVKVEGMDGRMVPPGGLGLGLGRVISGHNMGIVVGLRRAHSAPPAPD